MSFLGIKGQQMPAQQEGVPNSNFLSRLLGVDAGKMGQFADRIGGAANRIAQAGGAEPGYWNPQQQMPVQMMPQQQEEGGNFLARLFGMDPNRMNNIAGKIGNVVHSIARAGGSMPGYRSMY